MEDNYFRELKKQAYFFFKTNIKMARLALTDVTPAQLLTEEATSGNPWPPDSPTMREITRATFEVDDFFRIVEILHKRLEKFDGKDWRGSYNALILLEHVLTHGPKSFVEEFEDDNYKQVLMEMDGFHFVDHKGFDWGHSVRKLSGRVIKLLEDQEFLQQERIKARNLNRGIHGFGNLNRRSFPFPDSRPVRLNYNKHLHSASNDRKMAIDEKEEETRKNAKGKLKENGENMEIDHPFSPIKHHRLSQSLLQNNGHSSPPPLQN
uniref:ENTH domain-containing protein n=1 Tax=Cucumis melo TaxID=3656 RepID=A0A9I9DU39_CUCME